MTEKKNTSVRATVTVIALVCTAVFALAVGFGLFMSRQLPVIRAERVKTALESGNTAQARLLAEKISDEVQRRYYISLADYTDAKKLMDEGQWLEAESAFLSAGGIEDSANLARKCRYNNASELFDKGAYGEAADAFMSLGGFDDAPDRYDECRYLQAIGLYEGGMPEEALELLDELKGYADADEIAESIIAKLNPTPENMQEAQPPEPETEEETVVDEPAQPDAETAIPAETPARRGRIIAAGYYHTAAVTSEGRVLACGDNSWGQCDTSEISGAVSVAAGAYHTAVLLDNGTVVCTGRNSEGQCNTEAWTDIIAVAAPDWATVGLRSDGTLVYAGSNDCEEICSWTGIEKVSADSYTVCALRKNGRILTSPARLAPEGYRTAAEIDCSTGYCVLLLEDGTVACTAADTSAIHNASEICATPNGIIVIKNDGSVDAVFFMERNRIDFSEISGKAVAVDACATHAAFVLEDGSVFAAGDNSRGQCETAGWKLF